MNPFLGDTYKYGYNGVEFNDDLGLNLHEMDLRLYDPAIARFNGFDPVTHFSQGTSVAFDNNPVYWADPSGGDSDSLWANGTGSNKRNGRENSLSGTDNSTTAEEVATRKDKENRANSISSTINDVLKNSGNNTITLLNFNIDKFKAVMNSYNAAMRAVQINKAVYEVFKGDRDKIKQWRINDVISLDKTNKIVGKQTSFLWSSVEFDENYNVTGSGNGDFFINYHPRTKQISSITTGRIDDQNDIWNENTTMELGQTTFLGGWYGVSFHPGRNQSGNGINFIGFKTQSLRKKYVEYWDRKRKQYVQELKKYK